MKIMLKAILFAMCSVSLSLSIAQAAPKASEVMLSTLPPSQKNKCLDEGKMAPDFALKLINGGEWKLSQKVKSRPQVIVFYRGGWCPYCNLQLRNYQVNYSKIKEAGADLLAISVDRVDEKIGMPNAKLPFPVASDPDLKSIIAYNLEYKVPEKLVEKYLKSYSIDIEAASGKKHHTIAVPAIVIVGKDQKIMWCYANEDYKIRPAVDVILTKLK